MRINKFLFTLGILFVSVTAQAASRQWVHIHVEDSAKEEKVKVNIPLALVETMVPLIEQKSVEKGRIRLQDSDLKIEDLRRVWAELRDAGDMEFVTIESKDTNLRIATEGKFLLVQPQEGSRDRVNIRVPLAVVDALLSGKGEELNLVAAIQALQESGIRDIITVQDNDTMVRVWIDENNKGQ